MLFVLWQYWGLSSFSGRFWFSPSFPRGKACFLLAFARGKQAPEGASSGAFAAGAFHTMETTTTTTEAIKTAKTAKPAKGKALTATLPPIVAGYDSPAALDLTLSGLNHLNGRELQDSLAAVIRELGKSKPAKVLFSSDKTTRKAQMGIFKDATKAHKLLTQRVYCYLDKRGLGEISTAYRANVTATGLVRATESTTLKLGGKGNSVNI